MALGAFVAGMLLSETEYRIQVEDDIRPFRDILLGFFFITVGMSSIFSADRQLAANPDFIGNPVGLESTGRLHHALRMKNPVGDSLKSALYLAQGGEFGFVMLAISSKINMVSPELEQAATAASCSP